MKKYLILPIMMLLSLILVACTNDIGYVVTFYADGATLELRTQDVSKDEKALEPANPEKAGYKFLYWQDSLTGEEFDFADGVTRNVVLVAKFEKLIVDYKVTFDFGYDDLVEEVEVTEGQKITDVPRENREGYKLLGWYLDDYRFDFNQPINNNLLLVAQWEKLSQNEQVYAFLQDLNYESVLEEGFTLNLTVDLGTIVTPYDEEVPESVLGAQINDIKLEVLSHFNPETLFFHNEINLSFKSISFIAHVAGNVVVMDANWFGSGSFKQTISYKDNKLYSSFSSKIKSAGIELSIADLLETIGMFIPGEYGEMINEYLFLLENYEEYKELNLGEAQIAELIIGALTGLNLINNIPDYIILNSPLNMTLEENELTVIGEDDFEFLLVVRANEENNLSGLTFTSELEEKPINLVLEVNKVLEEPDFSNYVKVDKLRIENISEI